MLFTKDQKSIYNLPLYLIKKSWYLIEKHYKYICSKKKYEPKNDFFSNKLYLKNLKKNKSVLIPSTSRFIKYIYTKILNKIYLKKFCYVKIKQKISVKKEKIFNLKTKNINEKIRLRISLYNPVIHINSKNIIYLLIIISKKYFVKKFLFCNIIFHNKN